MDRKRITYFDEIKGVSIILVVFCHHVVLSNETFMGNLFMTLAWAAVPCFFMVTGGLMHGAKKFTWKKQIERLFKVYFTLVIWKCIYLCFYSAVQDVSVDIIGVIRYLFFMGEISNVDTGPMWFMYAYLQALIIYPITYYLHSDNKMGKKNLFYIFFTLWCTSILQVVMNFFGINIMDSLWEIVPFAGYKNMLCYFILGSFLFDYRDETKRYLVADRMKKGIPLILIILGIVGNLYIKYLYTGSFRWNGIYLDNGYNRMSTMLMALGLYLCFSINLFSKEIKIFSKLGKHTMGIFYLHYPMLIIYKKICNMLFEDYTEYYSFGLNVIQTVVVIGGCVFITMVMKRIPLLKSVFS